jgi:hypothetical protein
MFNKGSVVKMLAVGAAIVSAAQAELQTLHTTTAWQSLGVETIGTVTNFNPFAAWWATADAKTTSNNGVKWRIGADAFDNTDFDFNVGDVVDFQVYVYKEYAGGHKFDALRVWMDDALVVDGKSDPAAVFTNSEWSVPFGPATRIDQMFAPVEFSYTFSAEGTYDLTARVTCSNDLSQLSGWYDPTYTVSNNDWNAFTKDVSFNGWPKNGQGETEKYSFNVTTRSVPEPTVVSLLGFGLIGLLVVRRKSHR